MAPISFSLAAPILRHDLAPSSGLDFSSLQLNTRSTPETSSLQTRDDGSTLLSPIRAHDLAKQTTTLYKRETTSSFVPGQGSRPPGSFNNQAFMGLFAFLGAAMVIASLWFFFWAKNGGFKYQEGDWDDYKSTVFRRKGPDGRTLSNATKSTKLGGSTIAGTQHYKWARQTAKSVVSYDEKGRKGITGKRGWGKTHSVTYTDDHTTDSFGTQTVSDMTEIREGPEHNHHNHSKRYRDRDVQDYKKERSARVGGLNRAADGSHVNSNLYGSDVSASSEQPILQKSKDKARERERAEQNARQEAAKMERRWKREAEEAAAALARENAQKIQLPKKSAAPSKPAATKQRTSSRSTSPRKRDSSHPSGPATEVLSTAFTGTTSNCTASYYDAYRPQASESPRYSSGQGQGQGQARQSSPKKKPAGGRQGGYRRGDDRDLD